MKEQEIERLKSVINDLTFQMWLNGYPFDDNHKAKQQKLIDDACVLIEKPRTIEELKTMIKYKM